MKHRPEGPRRALGSVFGEGRVPAQVVPSSVRLSQRRTRGSWSETDAPTASTRQPAPRPAPVVPESSSPLAVMWGSAPWGRER